MKIGAMPKVAAPRRKVPSLMRALEQRFLFDGAALIDGLALTSIDQSSTSSLQETATDTLLGSEYQASAVALGKTEAESIQEFVAPVSAQAVTELQQAIDTASHLLSTLPDRSDFSSVIEQSFRTSSVDQVTWAAALNAIETSLKADGLRLQIKFLPSAQMGGALGGYAAISPDGGDAIYLNEDWIAAGASSADIAAVLLEEAGHAIDHRFMGPADAPGDEGELFSRLVRSCEISTTDLDRIRSEDDHAQFFLGSEPINVETALGTVTTVTASFTEGQPSGVALFTYNAPTSGDAGTTFTISVSNSVAGDQLQIGNAYVSITTNTASAQSVGGFSGITYTISDTSSKGTAYKTITFTSIAAISHPNAKLLIDGLRYQSISDDPTNKGQATSRIFVFNGSASTSTVTINAVNDAPTATFVTTAFSVTEDVPGNLTGIAVADLDSSNLTVTLSADAGTLIGNGGGGNSGVTITGSNTLALTLSGTATALNTWLGTAGNLQYKSALNDTTNRVLTIKVDDLSAANANPSNTYSATVSVVPVNDAPVFSGRLRQLLTRKTIFRPSLIRHWP